MHLKPILSLAAIVMVSCGREPTTPPPTLTQPVAYYSGGGFTGYGTELSISQTGSATAWYVAEIRQPLGERQLSPVEVRDLQVLLAPFCQYDDSYGRLMADAMISSITYGCDHHDKIVVVYNSDLAEAPVGWLELEAQLRGILTSLAPGV